MSPADRWSWAGGTPASSHEDWQSSLKLFWTYLPSGAQFTPDIHNTPAMCWWYLGSAAQQAGYILLWKHSYKRDLLIALSLSAYKMVEVRLFARETNISCLSEECSSCLLPGCHQAEINEIQRVNMQEKKTSLWLRHCTERCRYSSPDLCTRNCSLGPKQSLDKMHKHHHQQNNSFLPIYFLYFSQLLHWMWQTTQRNSVGIT